MRERGRAPVLWPMTMGVAPRNTAMFMAPLLARSNAHLLDLPEHLFWVVLGKARAFGLTRHQSPTELRRMARSMAEGWNDLLQELIAEAAEDTLVSVPLHTAQRVSAWQTTRVTLLGDAIHTMTPLQGLGGNTALVDAALLCQRLVDASLGRTDLVSALSSYEAEMRQYGFEAVSRSLQVSEAVASSNRVGRFAFRTVLRA